VPTNRGQFFAQLDLLSHQKDGDLSGTHLKDVLAVLSHVAHSDSVSRSVATLFERFVAPADCGAPVDGVTDGVLSQFVVRMFTGIDWASSASTAAEMAQRVGLFGTLLLLAAVAEDDAAAPALPDAGDDEFLLRFRAITQLCGCVAHLAADLEARAVGRHDLALLLYELLLALPPRFGAIFAKKRGAWLKRVLINADVHLKRPLLALGLARQALAAARREAPGGPLALLESDEVDLRDRVRALAQRLQGQQLRQRSVDPVADPRGATEDSATGLLRVVYAHLHSASSAVGGAEDGASRRRLLTVLVLRELHCLHAQPLWPGDLWRQLRVQGAGPSPAAPQLASPSPGNGGSLTWECVACTFVNTAARFKLSCEVCGTRRGGSTLVSPPRAAAAVVDLLSQSSDDSDVVELTTDAAAAAVDAPWQFETLVAAALEAAPPLLPPPATAVSDDDGDGEGEGDCGGSDARAGDVRGLVALIGALQREDAAPHPPPPPPTPSQWTAPAFAVHARRQFLPTPGGGATPTSAAGKSRFYIGSADAFGSVEELVMDRLRRFDVDELLHDAADDDAADEAARRAPAGALRRFRRLSYCQLFASPRPPAADSTWLGDGWRGWHCEGSLLRCLAGLLLWDVVFAPLPAVLLTRFQTAPLDYGSPSFFRRRRALVLQRVDELTHGALAQPAALLAEIRRLFVAHRGCVARHLGGLLNPAAGGADADGAGGVSLRLLQLLALCLGPPCLGRLCLAMAASQSQWRSGAPDLLLVRVSAETPAGDRAVLPLEALLGAHWQQLSARATERRSAATDADWADDFCAPPQRFAALPNDAAATSQRRRRRSGAGDAAADVSLPSLVPAAGGGGGGGGDGDDKDDDDDDDDLARPLRLPRAVAGCALVFEALLVEVKGPTDALAYKQWLWLQLLNLRVRPPSSPPDDAPFDCYAPAHDLRGGRALFDAVAADGAADGALECAYEQRPVVAFVGLVREQRVSAATGDDAPQKPPRRRRAPADGAARSKKARPSASPAGAGAEAADELVAFDFADDGDDWRPADA
jgi:hypothetical protein